VHEILLTRGKMALVDDDDFEWLSEWKWQAIQPNPQAPWLWYARNSAGYMHRLILGLTDRHIQTDHRDNNGLNNQRSNLRPATSSQNGRNRRLRKGISSQYRGVRYHSNTTNRVWEAQIKVRGANISLGYFEDEIEAAKAYDEAARAMLDDFARTNFLVDGGVCA